MEVGYSYRMLLDIGWLWVNHDLTERLQVTKPQTGYAWLVIVTTNRLAKPTLHKPYFYSERVYNVYPDHANDLHKAGLEPPIFPAIIQLWKGQDEKTGIENKKETRIQQKEN